MEANSIHKLPLDVPNQEKEKQLRTYVWWWFKTTNKSEAVCVGESQELRGQLKEKYFDYNGVTPDCPDNPKKIFRLFRLQHRWLRCQLWLITLEGSISTHPGVRKSPSRPAISSTSATRQSQTTLGGLTTASPPIVIVILRQQLDYVIIDYTAPTTPHPIKAKFSSSKSRLLLSPHPTLGGSAMNNHPAYHWFRKIVKALVASWRSLSNTCQFSLQSHEGRLTVGKAKILGRQANEKA
jgi:hypothetical protein